MIYTVELHPLALMDLKESYQWYEARSEGLGKSFLNSINKCLEQVIQYPESYPKKKGNYREAIIDNFPFIIIYEIFKKEHIILVSYIFHTRRNPKIKYKR